MKTHTADGMVLPECPDGWRLARLHNYTKGLNYSGEPSWWVVLHGDKKDEDMGYKVSEGYGPTPRDAILDAIADIHNGNNRRVRK